MRAWYMDEDPDTDQREKHQKNPGQYFSLEELFRTTGVEYFKVGVPL